jgi:hypothetical protein
LVKAENAQHPTPMTNHDEGWKPSAARYPEAKEVVGRKHDQDGFPDNSLTFSECFARSRMQKDEGVVVVKRMTLHMYNIMYVL